jgi:hypothetical protein
MLQNVDLERAEYSRTAYNGNRMDIEYEWKASGGVSGIIPSMSIWVEDLSSRNDE